MIYTLKAIRFTAPIFLLLTGLKVGASESVHLETLSWDSSIKQVRWMAQGAKIQGPMMEMRKAAFEQRWQDCLAQGDPARAQHADLHPWIVKQELECLQSASGLKVNEVIAQLNRAKDNLLKSGPWSSELGATYREAHVQLLESTNASISKAVRERIANEEGLLQALGAGGRAKFLEKMGDNSTKNSHWQQAQLFYRHSLANNNNSSVESKLQRVEKKLNLPGTSKSSGASSIKNEGPGAHQKEFANVQAEQRKNRHYEAAQAGLKFLEKHPGSSLRNDAVSLIYRSFNSLKGDGRKSRLIKYMAQAELEIVRGWARDLAGRGDFATAADLKSQALKRADGLSFQASHHIQVARRFHWAGDYRRALEHFEIVRERSGGTPEYIEATFYKGMSELRSLKYKAALKSFNEIVDLSGTEEAEPYLMGSLYWTYRAHEILEEPEKDRDRYYDQLIKDYPITYYSFLLHAERNDGTLKWMISSTESKPEGTFVFLPSDQRAWARAQNLLAVGWYDEASAELRSLPTPMTPEQKIVFARYLAAAMAYPLAIRILNQAWDEETQWRNPEVVRLAYPIEFKEEIQKAAEENKLSPLLVTSLIRQESAFSVPALSRSNAIGLMQLIPPTAREVLGWMGLAKKYKVPKDIYQPTLNLRLGSRYLRHVVRQFNQHVPIALASYNAGPTRMRRWLNAREETKELSKKENWEPIDDLWIDELPWGEPRFYVKAILRNAIVYQLLEEDEIVLERPVWKSLTRQ